jgi:UDP-glucuronate 4-epimerase
MMQRSLLVTGGAGFIGFHLALRLQAKGDRVICLDNFNSYYTPQLKRMRADKLNALGVPVIEGDICNSQALTDLVQQHRPTHFVHLAAQAGVRYSLQNPQAYIDTNISGFLNVLETCKQHPEMKLIYASSSSVYGRNTKIPFSIEDRTDQQVSLYGVTKKCNELMAFTYHHLYGIPMMGLRFFTVYGPWGRPDMAYYSFCKAIVEGQPIDLYNYGNVSRDFTYIDDIVDGILASIDHLQTGCALFNLGNHRSEPVTRLVHLLETALGKKADIRYLPMQPEDVENTYADIADSVQLLNFTPATSLDVGIPKFVEWYQHLFLCK